MAAAGVSALKICDVTQCPICLETYKEPKALPCVHTFCLQCLDKHCEDKEQEQVACPLCQKVFAIPPGGNKDLPDNFFILQLLRVQQSSTSGRAESKWTNTESICGQCSDSGSDVTSYCIECDQQICERCSAIHTETEARESHRVVRDAGTATNVGEHKKVTVGYCDQHPLEKNRLYCNDCKKVTCQVCSAENHRNHYLMDVKESDEKFHRQLKDDIENVTSCTEKKLEMIKRLEIDTSLFTKSVATTHAEISQKYDELISLIQSHRTELLEELNELKDEILKKVETMKEEIKRQFVIAESFKRYCLEIMWKGTACDISREGDDLHARAEELMKTRDEPDCHFLRGGEIAFKPTFSSTEGVENVIGELVIKDATESMTFTELVSQSSVKDLVDFIDTKPPLNVIPGNGQPITGITVLDGKLYAVRNASQVGVYKSDDFASIENLTISGSEQLRGIVSCSHYNCLYVSDPGQKIIYRYDLPNCATTNWSVRGACYALSVTKSYNVLATLGDTNRIEEYNTCGSLIREMSLDKNIEGPYHCVQLSTGDYCVSNVGTLYPVCIVDHSGKIVLYYGGSLGSDVGQLNPCHLVVDVHDNVLVADWLNNRVQVLSPTLTYLFDVCVDGHHLKQPSTVYFDEVDHRLYIGECTGQRILILD